MKPLFPTNDTLYQPSPEQLLKILQDQSKNFAQFKTWLADNKDQGQYDELQRTLGTLQAINLYWTRLGAYSPLQLNTLIVYLVMHCGILLHQISKSLLLPPVNFAAPIMALLVELRKFLIRPKFITFQGDDKKVTQSSTDVLSLQPLFAALVIIKEKLPPVPTELNTGLDLVMIVDVLHSLAKRYLVDLATLSSLIENIGSLVTYKDFRSSVLVDQAKANLNGIVNLFDDQLTAIHSSTLCSLLAGLGHLAQADQLNQPINLGVINKLLGKLAATSKKFGIPASHVAKAMKGLSQLMQSFKITSFKDLDRCALETLLTQFVTADPLPNSSELAGVLQRLERLHFYIGIPTQIPFEDFLQALQLALQQGQHAQRQRAVSSGQLGNHIGRTLLSLGQLIEANPHFYYPQIEGTAWIETICKLLQLLQTILRQEEEKRSLTGMGFLQIKHIIFALNGMILAGKSSRDEVCDYLFEQSISQPQYLSDNQNFSAQQRQERLKLVRQLNLYAMVTRRQLPSSLVAFLESCRPPQPAPTSFEAKLVFALKEAGMTEVGMEKGPVHFPYDVSGILMKVQKEGKEINLIVDNEIDGPEHWGNISIARNFVRDGILSFLIRGLVVHRFRRSSSLTIEHITQTTLASEDKWVDRERPQELYQWLAGQSPKLVLTRKPTTEQPVSVMADILLVASSSSSTTASESSVTTSLPTLESSHKKAPPPRQNKIKVVVPSGLLQWIQWATVITAEKVKQMPELLLGWHDESLLTTVLLAVLTESWRCTDEQKKQNLQKISEQLIEYLKPTLLLKEQQGLSPLILVLASANQRLLALIERRSTPPKASTNRRQRKKKQTQPPSPMMLDFKQALNQSSPTAKKLRQESLSHTPEEWVAWRQQQAATIVKDATPSVLSQDLVTSSSLDSKIKIEPLPLIKLADLEKDPNIFQYFSDVTKDISQLSLLAEDGDIIAQSRLGSCYFYGIHVEQDFMQAFKWLRSAAEQGQITAQYLLGKFYAASLGGIKHDLEQSVHWYQAAANQGHPGAQHKLGCYHHEISKNFLEAARLFNLVITNCPNSSIQVSAQVDLAVMYEYGRGVPQDIKRALKFYKLSADAKCVSGQYQLGRCYLKGIGEVANPQKGIQLLQLAADQKEPRAQSLLGKGYVWGNHNIPVNVKEGIRLLRLAANQKDSDAQVNLGHCYRQGKGVPFNPEQAVEWYTLAAEQDDAEAQSWLGICFAEGNGVTQDHKQAFHWIRLAAERTDPNRNALINLGRYYQLGIEGLVTIDLEKALHYYQLAERNENFLGHPSEHCRIAMVLMELGGRDAEALQYFTKAAKAGHPHAQLQMGMNYEHGQLGLTKNLRKAEEYYSQAAQQGITAAKIRLQVLQSKPLNEKLKYTGSPLVVRSGSSSLPGGQSSTPDSKAKNVYTP